MLKIQDSWPTQESKLVQNQILHWVKPCADVIGGEKSVKELFSARKGKSSFVMLQFKDSWLTQESKLVQNQILHWVKPCTDAIGGEKNVK